MNSNESRCLAAINCALYRIDVDLELAAKQIETQEPLVAKVLRDNALTLKRHNRTIDVMLKKYAAGEPFNVND